MADLSTVTAKASKKVGARPVLLAPVVQVIVDRDRDGMSVPMIAEWLQCNIGADNAAAQTRFVRWVLAEAGKA